VVGSSFFVVDESLKNDLCQRWAGLAKATAADATGNLDRGGLKICPLGVPPNANDVQHSGKVSLLKLFFSLPLWNRVARWFLFEPNVPIWANFWGP
jgi:hypothetical protein